MRIGRFTEQGLSRWTCALALAAVVAAVPAASGAEAATREPTTDRSTRVMPDPRIVEGRGGADHLRRQTRETVCVSQRRVCQRECFTRQRGPGAERPRATISPLSDRRRECLKRCEQRFRSCAARGRLGPRR